MSFEAITFNTEDEFKNYLKEHNIMTQEEVNKLVGSEKAKAKSKAETEAAEKYKDFETFKEKAEKYDSDIATKDGKIKELEDKVKKHESDSARARIAKAAGLPESMADRIRGETEDELKADAEALAKIVVKKEVAPLGDPEGSRGDGSGDDERREAIRRTIKKFRKEDE